MKAVIFILLGAAITRLGMYASWITGSITICIAGAVLGLAIEVVGLLSLEVGKR